MRRRNRLVISVLVPLAYLALMPALAHAQSQIAGLVSDNTGGVLPGVTVEACSPALIEGCRVAVTGSEGRYVVVDLRTGTYRVTFTLPGFATVVREGILLSSDFTLPLNAEMRVGALEETVTVSGESPVVDVQQARTQQTLSREVIDSVPAGRTNFSRAQLIPGVKLSRPDYGGSNTAQQAYISIHGTTDNETTMQMDGQTVNAVYSNGGGQTYFNDAIMEEMVFQTSGIGADTDGGGLRVNLVPRDGGNDFSGTFLYDAGYDEGYSGFWPDMVGNNLSQRLKDRRVTSITSVSKVYDVNGTFGGPVLRNRLWFYTSFRRQVADRPLVNSFYQDGRPGLDDGLMLGGSARLTWQINDTNRWSAVDDFVDKNRYHAHTSGTVIEEASSHWYAPIYSTYSSRWTSTPTNRILIEAGFSGNTEIWIPSYVDLASPGRNDYLPTLPGQRIRQSRPAPGSDPRQVGPWYAIVSKTDLSTGRLSGASSNETGNWAETLATTGSMSYVTGDHTAKVGYNLVWGDYLRTTTRNGDLQQRYVNGVPDSVSVSNTPVVAKEEFYNLGIYAQDQWTVGRLTANVGLRGEFDKSATVPTVAPAGRFVGVREEFPKIEMPVDGRYFNWLPRIGLVYDLRGDAKTALKFSAGRYMVRNWSGIVQARNPMALLADVRDWDDCHYVTGTSRCSGQDPFGTNRDNIAQDWEIGPATQPFQRVTDRFDPDLKRQGSWEFSAGMTREVLPGVSASFNWVRRQYFNFSMVDNTAVVGLDNYTAFQVRNPLANADSSVCCPDGGAGQFTDMITIYNRNAAFVGRDQIVTNSPGGDLRSNVYTGFELGMTARIPGGGNVFGGWNIEKQVRVNCDSPHNPNTFRFCDPEGVDRDSGIRTSLPFQHELKFGASYPTIYGIELATSVRSLAGNPIVYTWSPPTAVFRAAGLTRTVSSDVANIPLIPEGLLYQDQKTIVDFSLGRWTTLPGGLRWKLSLDIYNLFNADAIVAQSNSTADVVSSAFGRNLGRVTETFVPRFIKFTTRLQF